MKGDQEKAIAAGCNGYIIKPIDTRAFPKQVAELLHGGSKGPLQEGTDLVDSRPV
jgi:two-component system, cell cycle response regulator DivK